MQNILQRTIYIFLFVFLLTAILVLSALGYMWFQNLSGQQIVDLPYMKTFVYVLIVEVVVTVVIFAKNGMKYMPTVVITKSEADTSEFMRKFVDSGSSVTIVSNRAAWLGRSEAITEAIKIIAENGTKLEIITPSEVSRDIRVALENSGVKFYVTGHIVPPEARFTLVNGDRRGGERLAIARGGHPDHEITVFDNNSGPQIIAMARDLVGKLKEASSA